MELIERAIDYIIAALVIFGALFVAGLMFTDNLSDWFDKFQNATGQRKQVMKWVHFVLIVAAMLWVGFAWGGYALIGLTITHYLVGRTAYDRGKHVRE